MFNIIVIISVECATANIELTSTIDAIDFKSKIKTVERMIETFSPCNYEMGMEEQVDENKEMEEQVDEDKGMEEQVDEANTKNSQ